MVDIRCWLTCGTHTMVDCSLQQHDWRQSDFDDRWPRVEPDASLDDIIDWYKPCNWVRFVPDSGVAMDAWEHIQLHHQAFRIHLPEVLDPTNCAISNVHNISCEQRADGAQRMFGALQHMTWYMRDFGTNQHSALEDIVSLSHPLHLCIQDAAQCGHLESPKRRHSVSLGLLVFPFCNETCE